MKNLTSISYVIPAYNCATTIEDAIKSIISGNFEIGDEIIIVNDCSTDDTPHILDSISKNYPIKQINNKINLGCPASRNIGISKSKNELIFNLDSDNLLVPKSRELLVRTLKETDADIVMFEKVIFFDKYPMDKTHEWIYPYSTFTIEDLFASNYNSASTSCFLYKKSSIEKFGKYNESFGKGLHESWLFILNCLYLGARISISKKSSYLHRYGHESLYIRESTNRKLERSIQKYILDRYSSLFDSDTHSYMSNNSLWLNDLNIRPIVIQRNMIIGRKGYLKFNKIRKFIIRFTKFMANFINMNKVK